jgi:hypothetical protein
MFVPANMERLQQLEELDFDPSTLFLGEPTLLNQPAPPRTVASIDDVDDVLGFDPLQPTALPAPPLSTEIIVQDRRVGQVQVNVEAMRQLLGMLEIDDVTLPDALGDDPIVATMEPALELRYHGADYQLTVLQGTSPTVELPDGVDLAQLGKAALRFLGMEQDEAERVSRSVDWSSTFVFPFPQDLSSVQQVTIGNDDGLLIGEDDGQQLYFQRGDRFFILILEGGDFNEAEILAAAESLN